MIRAAILLLLGTLAACPAEPVQVRWDETVQLFSGRVAQVTLTSGKKLTGQWLSVTDDSFVLVARRRRFEHKRSEILHLSYYEKRHHAQPIGAAAGLYVGGIIIAKFGETIGYGSIPLIVAGAWSGHRVGGVLDHRSTPVIVIDTPSAVP